MTFPMVSPLELTTSNASWSIACLREQLSHRPMELQAPRPPRRNRRSYVLQWNAGATWKLSQPPLPEAWNFSLHVARPGRQVVGDVVDQHQDVYPIRLDHGVNVTFRASGPADWRAE